MNERSSACIKTISLSWTCFLMLILCAATPCAANAQDTKAGELTVFVSGFRNNDGHAVVNLFLPGQDVLNIKYAFKSQRQEITNRRAASVFKDIPFGEYAISVFHDENDNGRLDHLFALPAEPLGFSNGFRLGVFSGLPSFEKLKFTFSPSSRPIEIRLSY